MQSKRNDLLTRLSGKKGRLPFFADLSYYYYSQKCQGKLPEKFQGAAGEVEFYKYHDAGMYVLEPLPFAFNVEFTQDVQYEEKHSETEILTAYKTQKGTITSTQRAVGFSFAYTEHFVKDIEDLFIMTHVFEAMRYLENYDAVMEVDERIGDAGLPLGVTPICAAPVQKLLSRWAGVEKTVELYCDYPDEFSECITRIENSQKQVFEILAKSPQSIIFFPENLSSEVTGHLFDEFNAPYYTKLNQYLHSYGKLTGIHIDGTLKPCLHKLSGVGFDIAEAITPYPVGDVKPEELRAYSGPEIILWGGLPGPIFTPQFSDDEFSDYVKRMVKQDDGKFVLGVGDQVPPDAVESRIRLVNEIIGNG